MPMAHFGGCTVASRDEQSHRIIHTVSVVNSVGTARIEMAGVSRECLQVHGSIDSQVCASRWAFSQKLLPACQHPAHARPRLCQRPPQVDK